MSDVNPVHDSGDALLLDLLDALVTDRGRTAAARALGVNYRTMMNCYQSRRVTRRMRQVLEEFRDSAPADEAGEEVEAGVEVLDGDAAADGEGDTLELRVAALEVYHRELRELVEELKGRLEELGRRVAALEGAGEQVGDTQAVDPGDGHGAVQGNARGRDWRPPRRRPGMPDAGVVTLEEQPDEAHAFGPAAPLVAEWREVRARVGDGSAGSRVDRALAAVRRWELEAEMLRDFRLTLPPDTEPLDGSRRREHVRWREEALADAVRELSRAKRARLLRRVATLGVWRG